MKLIKVTKMKYRGSCKEIELKVNTINNLINEINSILVCLPNDSFKLPEFKVYEV